MLRKSVLLSILLAVVLLAGCSSKPEQPLPPTSIPLLDPVPGGVSSSSGLIPPEHPVLLPEGFQVNVFAADLGKPLMMAFGPDQSLYVTEPASGTILRLPDRDGDGTTDGIEVAADDLFEPSGLAFYEDGSLYVAETTRVFRLTDPDGDGYFQERETIIAGIAAGGNTHRTIIFTPDWKKLYLAIGSSCNVCLEQDPRRGTIMRFNPDGSDGKIFTRGLRNVVGMDFTPGNKILWVAVMERSGLEKGLPPETLYPIFLDANGGWPYCHAGRIQDPDFGKRNSCSEDLLTPVYELEAQTAPHGIEFYLANQFPEEYQQDLFVALHGSGEGESAAGYKIIHISLGEGSTRSVQDFAVGWLLEDGSHWGTPLDLVVGPDGSLFLSDDTSGTIYRIFYEG